LDPWILIAALPELPVKFMRDAIPGIDSPPELILLPVLPPTILPEFDIRGPKFPRTGEAVNPGAELRLSTLAKFEDKAWIEPPIAFMAPLLLIPECPWGIYRREKRKMRAEIEEFSVCGGRNRLWEVGEEPETWKLEGYLRGTGQWKYYHQVVEPLVMEDQSLKHFLVLVIQ
jgi:hypothetical protein